MEYHLYTFSNIKHKTINVKDLINLINEILRSSILTKEERSGIITLTYQMLGSTGNYYHKEYLTEDEVPQGQLPGIREIYYRCNQLSWQDQHYNTDLTRVKFLPK